MSRVSPSSELRERAQTRPRRHLRCGCTRRLVEAWYLPSFASLWTGDGDWWGGRLRWVARALTAWFCSVQAHCAENLQLCADVGNV